MKRVPVAVGMCLLALAACGDDDDAPPRQREAREERAQIDTGPRGAELDARCREIVRDIGVRMRMPARRAGETFRSYERRVRGALLEMGSVYRMLYLRLKDTPGTHDQKEYEPFQIFLDAVKATAERFEAVEGYRNRNRIELRSALVYPAKQYIQLAQQAKAMDAPDCAPPPG